MFDKLSSFSIFMTFRLSTSDTLFIHSIDTTRMLDRYSTRNLRNYDNRGYVKGRYEKRGQCEFGVHSKLMKFENCFCACWTIDATEFFFTSELPVVHKVVFHLLFFLLAHLFAGFIRLDTRHASNEYRCNKPSDQRLECDSVHVVVESGESCNRRYREPVFILLIYKIHLHIA